ncbi:MAG: VanZ family protein [Dysgonamonadaceae bacterium]|jgi:hypothetical protein|nr:VanZ family protein [Dysgonamonadaceae bacterium]
MPAFFVSIGRFWITLTTCIVILVLCFINVEMAPAAPMTNFDKLAHAVMFAGLSGVVFFDNTRYLRRAIRFRRIFSGSFLFPVVFGGLIEIVQGYATPHRSGDWMDFLFDAMGVGVGLLSCWRINRRLNPPANE